MTDVPEKVRELAAEREERRSARDFVAADELRDRIRELGFTVVDGPGGPTFERIGPAPPRRLRPGDVDSLLEDEPTADVSVHWVVEGWPEDVARSLEAFRANEVGRSVQYVVADVTETAPKTYGDGVEVLLLEPGTGWAKATNAGLKRSCGAMVLVVDGSIEPTGDVLGPLEASLEDPSVGVAGPFGIATNDLHEFHDSVGPAVDAIEGYLMAVRRQTLLDAGLFDEKFRWYRTADIEYSFRVKDLDRRATIVDVPVTKHEHRVWEGTPQKQRDSWSKKNFYRFLDRFRDRWDLLVDPLPEDERPHQHDHDHDHDD